MPKLVRHSEITDFKPFDAGTTQVLNTCTFAGINWFFKQPPALIVDVKAKTQRILNEAICGAIVLFLSECTHDSFLTPVHLLVVDDLGSPIGVLSQKIAYETFMDRGTDKQSLMGVLSMKGLAEISTVRFCIGDPDGNNNAGYGEEKTLSSIDYGLANFSYLLAQNALTTIEKVRLPEARGLGVFDITVNNVLSFILQPVDDVEFLVHHAFLGFKEYLAGFCDTNKDIVECFFSKVNNMLEVVSKELTAEGFNDRIFAALGLDALNESDRIICQDIIAVLVERANHLKATLRTLSVCSPRNFEKLVVESVSPSDGRFSPVMLSASPIYKRLSAVKHINAIMQGRAEEEYLSSIRSRGITPANGGGGEGYKDVLFPRSSSIRSTSRIEGFDERAEMSPFCLSPAGFP